MTDTGTFRAILLEESDGKVAATVQDLPSERLPDGDVTVRVDWSTLNYKDGLILNGLGRLVRTYPHVPGIDFAGTVEASQSPDYKAGDRVVLTGWRVGEAHWGGYATRARVKAGWLVKLPAGLDAKRAMAIGTAGFTAMQCVAALERHGLKPGQGEVLVTGASGGVGSVAVSILGALGYDVVAVTGRPDNHDYLRSLGAASFMTREEVAELGKRPLQSERFAGAIDTVGSTTLAGVLTAMRYRAPVAACGLAGGNDLNTTVIPFIIRGVSLVGIDSVMAPYEERVEVWERLARDLPTERLDAATEVIGLADAIPAAARILKGHVRGRLVIDVNA
jgi:acrylyl-CoA reductase (NADPH)